MLDDKSCCKWHACPNREIFSRYSRLNFSAAHGQRIWGFAFRLLVFMLHRINIVFHLGNFGISSGINASISSFYTLNFMRLPWCTKRVKNNLCLFIWKSPSDRTQSTTVLLSNFQREQDLRFRSNNNDSGSECKFAVKLQWPMWHLKGISFYSPWILYFYHS